MFALSTAGAVFPFNEDKASDDGVDRNSAIIGGKSHLTFNCQVLNHTPYMTVSIHIDRLLAFTVRNDHTH